jgi:hypothetical protein
MNPTGGVASISNLANRSVGGDGGPPRGSALAPSLDPSVDPSVDPYVAPSPEVTGDIVQTSSMIDKQTQRQRISLALSSWMMVQSHHSSASAALMEKRKDWLFY